MAKSPDAFRTISEVADWLGVQAHVLRFWESKFSQVKPVKRAGGRRYYRPGDMQLLGGIRKLLHDDGLTIKGVQKILREQGVGHVSAFSRPLEFSAADDDADIVDGTVVQFKSRANEPGQDSGPEAPDDSAEPETESPQQEILFKHMPGAGDAEDTVEDAADDRVETTPPAEPEPEPEPEAPRLPSFLHRDRTSPMDGPRDAGETGAQSAPKPRVVDAPDPPAETDIPVRPGMLAKLAAVQSLTQHQAAEIAPLAAELKTWMKRSGSVRAP